jgi:hypothetical protein
MIARRCFSHEAMNRPSGCQATALTIDLKEQENQHSENFNEELHTNNQIRIISLLFIKSKLKITLFERNEFV